MTHVETAIVLAKIATLVLGGLITYYAYKAYRRTRAPSLRALSIGFSVVTVGALVAGLVHQFTPIDILYSVLVQSLLTAVGFGVIMYSLYAD